MALDKDLIDRLLEGYQKPEERREIYGDCHKNETEETIAESRDESND